MKIRCTFICILLLSLISSCKFEDEDNSELKQFTKLQKLKDNTLIYVIPGAGCTGCISEAEKFAIEKVNNDSFCFLFTKIISRKLFKLKLPTLQNATNVIIDSLNVYQFPKGEADIYPIIYSKQNKRFRVKNYLKPN
jgi:hypothetical protein